MAHPLFGDTENAGQHSASRVFPKLKSPRAGIRRGGFEFLNAETNGLSCRRLGLFANRFVRDAHVVKGARDEEEAREQKNAADHEGRVLGAPLVQPVLGFEHAGRFGINRLRASSMLRVGKEDFGFARLIFQGTLVLPRAIDGGKAGAHFVALNLAIGGTRRIVVRRKWRLRLVTPFRIIITYSEIGITALGLVKIHVAALTRDPFVNLVRARAKAGADHLEIGLVHRGMISRRRVQDVRKAPTTSAYKTDFSEARETFYLERLLSKHETFQST